MPVLVYDADETSRRSECVWETWAIIGHGSGLWGGRKLRPKFSPHCLREEIGEPDVFLVFLFGGCPPSRPVGLRLASRSHIRFSLPRAQTLPPFPHSAGVAGKATHLQYNIYVIFIYLTYGVKFNFLIQ